MIQGSPYPVRYGPERLPPDTDTAKARLAALSGDIPLIEADLEHKEAESFPSDEEYEAWRRKAIRALGHTRAEVQFLERWVKQQERGAKEKLDQISAQKGRGRLAELADTIRQTAVEVARRIDSHYTPAYSLDMQPPDLETARHRLVELLEIRRKVEEGCRDVSNQWQRYPLNRKDLPGVKAPLTRILDSVLVEQSAIKASLSRLNEEAQRKATTARDQPIPVHVQLRVDWKQVCLVVIDRAVAQGVELTPEEELVRQELRKQS